MSRSGGNITAFSPAVCLLFALCDQCYFAFKDDMSCFCGMSVIGIERVWRVLPDVSCLKPFRAKLLPQRFFVRMLIYQHVLRNSS